MERQCEHSASMSFGKREALAITTKLLKESTAKSTSQLQELQVCNGNLGIREESVRVGRNLYKVRRLFFKNSGLHTVGWVVNEDIEQCMECARAFHLLRRRHHCRKCGNVICSVCSRSATIENCEELGLTRICTRCYYATDRHLNDALDAHAAQPSRQSVEHIPIAKWKTFSGDSNVTARDGIPVEQNDVLGPFGLAEEEQKEGEADGDANSEQPMEQEQQLESRSEPVDGNPVDLHSSQDELLRQACEANQDLELRVANLQAELESAKKRHAASKRKLSQANKRLENNFSTVSSHVQSLDKQRVALKERVDYLEKERQEWLVERCQMQSALKAIEDQQWTRDTEASTSHHHSLRSVQVEETCVVERIFVRERIATIQYLVTKLIDRSQSRTGDKENRPNASDSEEVALLKQLQDSLALPSASPVPQSSPLKATLPTPLTPVQERDCDFGIDSKDYCSPLPNVTPGPKAVSGRLDCE